MFWGQIAQWAGQKVYLPQAVQAAFNETLKQDLLGLVPGRYPLASVKDAFFIIQQFPTKMLAEARPESHKRFIDVQYLLSGAERIGMAQADANDKPIEERWAKDDVAFFAAPPDETFIDLAPGAFVIFFPNEIHRPNCCIAQPIPIRKTVVKIPLEALFA